MSGPRLLPHCDKVVGSKLVLADKIGTCDACVGQVQEVKEKSELNIFCKEDKNTYFSFSLVLKYYDNTQSTFVTLSFLITFENLL